MFLPAFKTKKLNTADFLSYLNQALFLIIINLIIINAGCSTLPVSQASKSIVVKSITISPRVLPAGGFALVSLDAFDADGNEINSQIGTGEVFNLKECPKKIFCVTAQNGTQEVTISLTNGRQDLIIKEKVIVDQSLTSTILKGTTTLPVGKSFDFLSGEIKDKYFGDMDYLDYYEEDYQLDFGGNGRGEALCYSDCDGGLTNLTYSLSIHDLSKVILPYKGYYRRFASLKYGDIDSNNKLQVGDSYAIWFMRGATNYFAKIKIISLDDKQITFDWVVQADPQKERFYD